MGALSYSIGVEYKGGGEYQVDPNQYEGNGWQRKVYSWMVVMGDCYSSSSKWIDSECLNFMCYMAQGNIDTVIHKYRFLFFIPNSRWHLRLPYTITGPSKIPKVSKSNLFFFFFIISCTTSYNTLLELYYLQSYT